MNTISDLVMPVFDQGLDRGHYRNFEMNRGKRIVRYQH